jgi:hypothetical protein
MLRAIVMLGLGVLLIAGFYFYFGKSVAEERITVNLAVSKPDAAGNATLNIAVPMSMVKRNPPVFPGNRRMSWPEWIPRHYVLTDAAGTTIPLQYLSMSDLMNDQQSGGTPEFWLKASLKAGTTYNLTHTPIFNGDDFKYSFTVSPDGLEPGSVLLSPG